MAILPSRINETEWINTVEFKTVSACQNGSIIVTEVVQLSNEIQYTHPENSPAICIANSNRVYFIAGFQDGSIAIRMNTRTKIHTINVCSYAITAISIISTENIFVTAGIDGVIHVFTLFEFDGVNPSKFTCLNTCFVSPSPITDIFFVPLSSDIIVSSLDNTIRVFKYPSFEGRIASESFKTGGLPAKIDYFRKSGSVYSSQFLLHQAEGGNVVLYDIIAANAVSSFGIFENSGIAISCNPQFPQFAAGGGPNDGHLFIVTIQPQSLAERTAAGTLLIQKISGLPSIRPVTQQSLPQIITQKAMDLNYPVYSEDFADNFIPPPISQQMTTDTAPRTVKVTSQPIVTQSGVIPLQLPHLSELVEIPQESSQNINRREGTKTFCANVQSFSTNLNSDLQFQQIQVPETLQEISSVLETNITQSNENKKENKENMDSTCENNKKDNDKDNDEETEENYDSKNEEETKNKDSKEEKTEENNSKEDENKEENDCKEKEDIDEKTEENESNSNDDENKEETEVNHDSKNEEETENKDSKEEKTEENNSKEENDDIQDEEVIEENKEENENKDEEENHDSKENENENKEDTEENKDEEENESNSSDDEKETNDSESDNSKDDENKEETEENHDSKEEETKQNENEKEEDTEENENKDEEENHDSKEENKEDEENESSSSDDEKETNDSESDNSNDDESESESKSESDSSDKEKSSSSGSSSSDSSDEKKSDSTDSSSNSSSSSSNESSSDSDDDKKSKEREISKPKRGRGRPRGRGRKK